MYSFFRTISIILLTLCSTLQAHEVVVAVLDNQISFSQKDLQDNIYINNLEIEDNLKDDDHNSYIDDVTGWDFVNNRPNTIDNHQIEKFSNEVFEYYELKKIKASGNITQEQTQRLKEIIANKTIMDEKKEFTKYAHGTHIGCLAIGVNYLNKENKENKENQKNNANIKLLPITYLGENIDGFPDLYPAPKFTANRSLSRTQALIRITKFLNDFSEHLINKFERSISYSYHKAKVLNASWGQSFGASKEMIEDIFKEQFNDEISESDQKEVLLLTKTFMKDLLSKGHQMIKKYPDMLFIFSAGNSGDDNDEFRHYPSGINLPNTISVAAFDKNDLATFSNFGKNSVTISYPGVSIESCIPGDETLAINGTSQAAGGVSFIAAKLFSEALKNNLNVTPANIKRIIVEGAITTKKLQNKLIIPAVINLENSLKIINSMTRK